MSVVESVRDRLFGGGVRIDWGTIEPIPLTRREIHDLLSSDRRALLLSNLVLDHDGGADHAALVEHIARVENGVPQSESITERQRKRTYVSLYQTHIPKLEMHGVVEWDDENNVVHAKDAAKELVKIDRLATRASSGVPK